MVMRLRKWTSIIIVVFLCIGFLIVSRFSRHLGDPTTCVQRIVIERPSLCRTASIFRCEHCLTSTLIVSTSKESRDQTSSDLWTFDPDRDARNYGLTNEQCDVAFPGLFEDIDLSVSKRANNAITKSEMLQESLPRATIHIMLYDSQLYVINRTRPELRKRAAATLHALYRAVLTSPSPLPNVEFALTLADYVDDPSRLTWSYTRTADDHNTWLMPDFGLWSYGEMNTPVELGNWGSVREYSKEVEQEFNSFSEKIPKAFWRGQTALAEDLREQLLESALNQAWADVKQFQLRFGSGEDVGNALPIHEHCKYMFLIHTEGNSYSGRLKYLQNCRSVIFAHTLEWIQPFEYLMVSSGPQQNFVEVARDFSDLAEKVEYYRTHLKDAERIANNSVATFRDRYNTPAAETCYWRRLIRSWRQVSFEPEPYDNNEVGGRASTRRGQRRRGTPFEDYILPT